MRASYQNSQHGIALIMALLIVALVTTVVVEVSWRFNLSMLRNENRWHGIQARSYLESGEQGAFGLLKLDAEQGGATDHLGANELWAQSQQIPTPEGWIRIQLEDAHSRFNLNSLVPPPISAPQPGQPPVVPSTPMDTYSEQQKRFVRFLQTIQLAKGKVDQQRAFEIVAAIADWIDADSNVTQGQMGGAGAEGSDYEGQNPPIVIANTEMTSISELALVKGITPDLYEKLKGYVVALPAQGFNMNINTMKPEVLLCLGMKENPLPLEESIKDALLKARSESQTPTQENPKPAGFVGISDITNLLIASGLPVNPGDFETVGLGVASNYFIFHGETLVGEQLRSGTSLLFRASANDIQVVRRTDSVF